MRKAVFALVLMGTLGGAAGRAWADQPAALASGPASDAVPKAGLAPIVSRGTALATIGSTTAASAGAAGTEKDAAPTMGVAAPAPKPTATIRMLRRINADRVVASLQPAFKDCYARSDSRASGIVVVRASTDADGQVQAANLVSLSGLPPGLGQCIADRVREARFNAPGGTGVSLLVPARLGP